MEEELEDETVEIDAGLVNRETCALILVDVQEKFMPAIHDADGLLKRCRWVLDAAKAMEVPIILSEQYPQGLGKTDPLLLKNIEFEAKISKTSFSIYGDENAAIIIDDLDVEQIVLIGIEAHVCVLQSALMLDNAGFEVFVVEDAISARRAANVTTAVHRMRQQGIQVINREMLLLEWLREAGSDEFRRMSQTFLVGDQP